MASITVSVTYDPQEETLAHVIQCLKNGTAGLIQGTETTRHEAQPAEVAVNKASEEKPATEPETAQNQTEPTPPATAVTKSDLLAMATKLSKAGKKAELKAAFAEFGADKLSSVSPNHYAALMRKLGEIGA